MRFRFFQGGLLYRFHVYLFHVYLNMASPDRIHVFERAVAMVFLTWFPLFPSRPFKATPLAIGSKFHSFTILLLRSAFL
jgi:hypothetical protein